MHRTMLRTVPFALLLVVLVLGAACGGDDDDAGTGDGATPTNAAPSVVGPQVQPEPPQAIDSARVEATDGVIELSAAGLLFADNNLGVAVGESVIIRVTNNDDVLHNLRVAGTDGEYSTEDDAVTTPEEIPADGGVGELTFAPPVEGFYTFRCDFHPTSMGGQIVAGDPGTPPPTPEGTPTPTPTVVVSESPLEG